MTGSAPPRTYPGQISRVPQMPGLDGLRAIAVVAVMVYHADPGWLHGGFLGVEVFFVISGYLITLLLIAEHERSGRIDLRQFWLRRFRRLLPALFVMLGLLMVYLAIGFRQAQGRTRGDIVGAIAYVSNWYQIWVGAGYTAAEAFAPLRHLWSLAVEEQFYLVWPLVMLALMARGRDRLPKVAVWLAGIALVITVAVAVLFVPGDIDSSCDAGDARGYWQIAGRCISVNDALYLGTFSRAGGILLGAAFAMVWRPFAIARGPLRGKGRQLDVLALVGLVVLGLQAWRLHLAEPAETILTGSRFDPWLFRGGFLVTALATLLVIAAITHRGAITGRLLGVGPLAWIGTRSYGLYLYHWPIYQIIRKQAGRSLDLGEFLLALAITIPLTELSFRLVEMPVRQGRIGQWLRRERRRASRVTLARRRQVAVLALGSVSLVGVAGASIAMAPNECVGEVECASEAGREAVASLPVPATGGAAGDVTGTTTATTPATSEAGGPTSAGPGSTAAPTTVTTVAPTTTLPVELRPPVAFGESVMLGAARQLAAGGFLVVAEEGRQADWIIEQIATYKRNGLIGTKVVIHAGTNGNVSAAQYDEMMSYLPASEGIQVVFLTVRAGNLGWIEPNNMLIYSLPGKYPNATVLDWGGLVGSGQIPGMASDGIHLGSAAAQTYANYIFEMIGAPGEVVPVG